MLSLFDYLILGLLGWDIVGTINGSRQRIEVLSGISPHHQLNKIRPWTPFLEQQIRSDRNPLWSSSFRVDDYLKFISPCKYRHKSTSATCPSLHPSGNIQLQRKSWRCNMRSTGHAISPLASSCMPRSQSGRVIWVYSHSHHIYSLTASRSNEASMSGKFSWRIRPISWKFQVV